MRHYLEPIFEDFEPLNEREVYEIEEKSNIKLPSSYKNFLLEFGRCMFSVEAIIEAEDTNLSIFTWFGAGENGNILEDMKLHPEFLEQKIIPIADTEFNDRFVLNGSNGKIQYIEYSAGSCKTIDIANSFDEFVGSIKFYNE